MPALPGDSGSAKAGPAGRCDRMAVPSPMEQAKSILPRLFQHQRLLDDLDLVAAFWPETVGEKIAQRTRPVHLGPSGLVVEVLDPPWIELVRPMAKQILGILRQELPDLEIPRIQFRVVKGEGAKAEPDSR